MKKRIGMLSLVGLTALLLSLMGVFSAMAAPAATVDGTITLDQAWYMSGATATVTVTDGDISNIGADTSYAFTTTASSLTTGDFVQLPATNVAGSPVVAPIGTPTRANAYPSTTASFTYTNASQGKGSLQVSGIAAGTQVAIIYQVGVVGSVSGGVKLTSTQSSAGISLAVAETGVQTGKGTVQFLVDPATSSATVTPTPKLLAQDGGTIVAAYTDTNAVGVVVVRTATARVDGVAPTITNLAPATNLVTAANAPTFSGTVADTGSGVQVATISITFVGPGAGTVSPSVTGNNGDSSVSFSYTYAITSVMTVGTYTWTVTAKDVAGNSFTSPAQTLVITRTAPVMGAVQTGRFWDTSTVSPQENKNKTTSLVVRFDKALDPTTVAPSDFTVDGATPTGAFVNPVVPTIIVDTTPGTGTSVYLTLGTALAPNATPAVVLVGAVNDTAGNTLTGSVTASSVTDKIAPTLTVTLSSSTLKAGSDLQVNVSANEPISGAPVVKVFDKLGGSAFTVPVTSVTATSWQAIFNQSAGSVYDSADSVSSNRDLVTVTASDLSGNSGSKGSSTPTSSSIIAFIYDGTVPTITGATAGATSIFGTLGAVGATPGAPASPTYDVPMTSPFVTMTYTEVVTVTVAAFGTRGGTLADVTSKVQISADGKTVSYAASGLTTGTSYQLRLTVADLLGNSQTDRSVAFNVVTRLTFDIQLKPGMNLVSVPNNPADTGINAVMNLSDIKSVVTYDPLNPSTSTGPWLSATRGADGKLSGNLASIDSMHAYWVNSGSFIVLKVNIPDPGFTIAPPAIVAKAGWNLVPVASLTVTGKKVTDPAITISADQYFASLANWITAYTFDPATNAWTKVLPKQFPANTVVIGNGYWLYTTTDGVLVP